MYRWIFLTSFFAICFLFGQEVDVEDVFFEEYEKIQVQEIKIRALIGKKELVKAEELLNDLELNYPKASTYSVRIELGNIYLSCGNKNKALHQFKMARPVSGCGNCMASMYITRNISIAKIYESKLNFFMAFFTYSLALPLTLVGGTHNSFWLLCFGLLYSGFFVIFGIYFCYFLYLRYIKTYLFKRK